MAQKQYAETGKKIPAYYTYDLKEIQERNLLMNEFKYYRKKFEKTQRAKQTNLGEKGKLHLDDDMFDPHKMQA